jgi:hypothetical protein
LDQTNQIAEMDQIKDDPQYEIIRKIAEKYWCVQAELAVPLTHDGKLVGVINEPKEESQTLRAS